MCLCEWERQIIEDFSTPSISSSPYREWRHWGSQPYRTRSIIYEQIQLVGIYTTWPKVCGHLLVEHLIPKSWALIWSWSPFAAITASTLLKRLSTRCWNIAAGTCFHSATRALVRSDLQSVFQFIPKVFDGVEVRALCRPVKFFQTGLDKPILYWPQLCLESSWTSLYAVPFTGTKGPSPNHEKQPQTIISPPPNFTVGSMHSGR